MAELLCRAAWRPCKANVSYAGQAGSTHLLPSPRHATIVWQSKDSLKPMWMVRSMAKRKKRHKQSSVPKRMRFNREQRLQSAGSRILAYEGDNVARACRKV